MLARAGPGVLALEGCVRRVDVLGPRHVAPCLRSTCAEVRLEDVACRPLWVGKERGVVGVALGHDLHLCWGDIHYGNPDIEATMCAYMHEGPVCHLQLVAPERQVRVPGKYPIEKRWLVIIITGSSKQDSNKTTQHGKISKQAFNCILNFFILSDFPNEHNVGATAVKDGS